MIWLLGFGACVLFYIFEQARYYVFRSDDPEIDRWRKPGGRWIADRVPLVRSLEYSTLHMLMPSDDPRIEGARRAMNASLAFAIGWLAIGWAIGSPLDRIAIQSAAVSPVFGAAMVGGSLLALVSAAWLVTLAREPDKARSLKGPS